MLVEVDAEQVRVAAIGAGGELEELYIERAGAGFSTGNIYKAKVQNVEPSLQAAFIDIGGEKNGFLHVGDIVPPFGGYDDVLKRRKRKAPKDSHPKIEDMLYKGQELLVQITRESLEHKGPSVTTYISIPGRYLVLMPAVAKRGVSKKITDEHERAELRAALSQLEPPKDMGYIIRTAGMGRGKEELQGDLNALTRLWDAIKERAKKAKPPSLLYRETDLAVRAVRDYVYDDVDEILVDSPDAHARVKEFLEAVMPAFAPRLALHEGPGPLFHQYGVEDQIARTFDRSVPLACGGEVVIESTEAMVAIDVNTGRFKKNGSTRDTTLAANKEAAKEIARQLRLRDLGGLVMLDFIDMDDVRDRREVEDVFRAEMKRDRARTTILPISPLGVMEMTRQRLRKSPMRALYEPCPACDGTGRRKSVEALASEFLRRLRAYWGGTPGKAVARLHPEMALAVANVRRAALAQLEAEVGATVRLVGDAVLGYDEIRFEPELGQH